MSTNRHTVNSMKDTRYSLILALSLLFVAPLSAQTRGEFGIDFIVAVPQGAFQQNVDHPGFGISAHGGFHLKGSPVLLGLDGSVQVYGTERRWVPLSTTIPDITARVETSNNIAQLHGLLRIQPVDGALRPYVDGLYGFNYLYTRTSLQDRFDEELIGTTNHDDVSLSYGFGAGMDIRLHNGPIGEDKKPGQVYLTLGIRYLLGGEAEYLREGDIDRGPGYVEFTTTRSRIDMFQPRIGVTIAF